MAELQPESLLDGLDSLHRLISCLLLGSRSLLGLVDCSADGRPLDLAHAVLFELIFFHVAEMREEGLFEAREADSEAVAVSRVVDWLE